MPNWYYALTLTRCMPVTGHTIEVYYNYQYRFNLQAMLAQVLHE